MIAPAIVGCAAIGGGIIALASAIRKRGKKHYKVGPNERPGQGRAYARGSDAPSIDNLPRSLEDALEQARAQHGQTDASGMGGPAWFDLEVPISRPPASTGFVFPH